MGKIPFLVLVFNVSGIATRKIVPYNLCKIQMTKTSLRLNVCEGTLFLGPANSVK